MKIFITLFIVLFSQANARSLKINKCNRADGTVIYQENHCGEIEFDKTKPRSFPSKSKKISKRVTGKEIPVNIVSGSNKRHIKPTSYKKYLSTHNLGHNTLSFLQTKDWKSSETVFNNKLFHLKAIAREGSPSFELVLDVLYPDHEKFKEPDLIDLLSHASSRYVQGSREKQLVIEKLPMLNGMGVVTSLSGSDQLKNFQHVSKGMAFVQGWLIQFTLFHQEPNDVSRTFILHHLIPSIQIKRKA